MSAVMIAIADAVVARLNAAALGFTAVRAYVPVYELPDLAALKVTVVPRELTAAYLSRGADDFAYAIDVAVQRRVDATDNATLDPLMLLTEGVMDLFRGQNLTLPDDTTALCTAAANAPIYAPDHLDEKRVFTSVVTLTFKRARPR